MKLTKTLVILASLFITNLTIAQTITNDFYNVKSGNGKGIRFWNNDLYKISMANTATYKYGPVTSYSLKSNMSNNTNRGWTWGVNNQTPVAALNTQGKLQVKSWIKTMGRAVYFGDVQSLVGDNASALYFKSNNDSYTQLLFRDKQNTVYGRITGATDGTFFGLKDADNGWTLLAKKNAYTALSVAKESKLVAYQNGRVHVVKNRDANGTPGSGSLEIANSLRLDNNEIITNTGATLHLNNDNNGNVHIDNTTFRVIANQNVVKIGSVSTDAFNNYKLFVEKGILTEKVKVAVKTSGNWSDYVFEDDYEMLPIEQLEEYVQENKHLPNVPSAQEMVEEGLDVATMDATLLEKIEEAHLYIIELHKELKELKVQLNEKK